MQFIMYLYFMRGIYYLHYASATGNLLSFHNIWKHYFSMHAISKLPPVTSCEEICHCSVTLCVCPIRGWRSCDMSKVITKVTSQRQCHYHNLAINQTKCLIQVQMVNSHLLCCVFTYSLCKQLKKSNTHIY